MDTNGTWLEPLAVNGRGIQKFEKRNNISVNVYQYDKKSKKVNVLRTTSLKPDFERKVANLLLLSNDKKHHYACISNLSRLVSTQTNKHKCKKFV